MFFIQIFTFGKSEECAQNLPLFNPGHPINTNNNIRKRLTGARLVGIQMLVMAEVPSIDAAPLLAAFRWIVVVEYFLGIISYIFLLIIRTTFVFQCRDCSNYNRENFFKNRNLPSLI